MIYWQLGIIYDVTKAIVDLCNCKWGLNTINIFKYKAMGDMGDKAEQRFQTFNL